MKWYVHGSKDLVLRYQHSSNCSLDSYPITNWPLYGNWQADGKVCQNSREPE